MVDDDRNILYKLYFLLFDKLTCRHFQCLLIVPAAVALIPRPLLPEEKGSYMMIELL